MRWLERWRRILAAPESEPTKRESDKELGRQLELCQDSRRILIAERLTASETLAQWRTDQKEIRAEVLAWGRRHLADAEYHELHTIFAGESE